MWFEDLPQQCPPNDAQVPNDDVYYRLINGEENPIESMVSQRIEFPTKKFSLDECTVRAVSIFKDRADCENITKLPR